MSHRVKVLSTLILVLAGTGYIATRVASSPEWRRFHSEDFWRSLAAVRLSFLLLGIAMVFSSYFFRSLRWREFLRPMNAGHVGRIFEATLIGCAAVALLGRPAEVVRPLLIARKEKLSASSQAAAWVLERVFDALAVAAILGAALVFFPPTNIIGARSAEVMGALRTTGVLLCAMALALAGVLAQLRWRPGSAMRLLHRLTRPFPETFRGGLQKILENFSAGLAGIDNVYRLLLCAAFSALVWIPLLVTYWSVARAFGAPLSLLAMGDLVLLLVATNMGSLAALPGIGGGTQLATILALTELFGIPPAMASSAAIVIWALTFMLVVVPGLPLAAREGLTWQRLRKLAHSELPLESEPRP
jgi:hypothetical protein